MDKTQDSIIYDLQATHFRFEDTHRLKIKGWKKISHANGKPKRAWVMVLASDKTDSKSKIVTRDKEGQYIIIKDKIIRKTQLL